MGESMATLIRNVIDRKFITDQQGIDAKFGKNSFKKNKMCSQKNKRPQIQQTELLSRRISRNEIKPDYQYIELI
ncbi:unnamed protein product (macronuclear) [Paramecium tetraurelia]|uniref:Uncharacterized protein n=1 Tax=Paramecium tetraurelia TaxID=5888 RepID=A0DII5_PARTE|nr:uncharacterized protein GSPATT00039516001 [Paramecium tetraurelia]CAK82852.1 unnamed protein product [Paramecium tetraurelia]|eukprot:XP_001450249.1 hypothetical protein (macronuclear) [Paramecium tetraurelia strain d4-2]